MKLYLSYPLSVSVETQAPTDEKVARPIDIERLLPGYSKNQVDALQNDCLIIPEQIAYTPTKRLVVLIPEGGFDENKLSHKTWRLASTASLPVLFLAISSNQENMAYLQRRLVTIAAATAFGEVKTGTSIVARKDWLRSIIRIARPGDLWVCLSEQRVPFRPIGQRALGEFLSTSLNAPVYLVGDMPIDYSAYRPSWDRDVFPWLASLAIIIAFTLLQIWAGKTSDGPASTLFLCLSIAIEFLLILKVND